MSRNKTCYGSSGSGLKVNRSILVQILNWCERNCSWIKFEF